MAAGAPRKFKSVEVLQDKIDSYFTECDPHWIEEEGWIWLDGKQVKQVTWNLTKQVPYTITGLALALDTTRETLLDYENSPQFAEFSDTIKKAKLRVHNFVEKKLFDQASTGAIFNLKNNYGWVDKTEQDINQKVKFVDDEEMPEDIELNKLLKNKSE